MALARVESAVGSDAGVLMFGRDRVQKFRLHRRVTQVAGGELGSSDFLRLLVNSDVGPVPDPTLRATVIVGIPLLFACDLDRRFVDQQVRRALRSAVRDVDLRGLSGGGSAC